MTSKERRIHSSTFVVIVAPFFPRSEVFIFGASSPFRGYLLKTVEPKMSLIYNLVHLALGSVVQWLDWLPVEQADPG